MFNKFVLLIALRYFIAKKNEKFVSVISAISFTGITIGVAALIVTMSVMNGFHQELTNNIIGINGDITITTSDSIADFELLKKNIVNKNKFVKKIVPIAYGQAFALGKNNSTGVIIKGLSIQDLHDKDHIIKNIVSGNLDDYSSDNAVVIGSTLANTLGTYVGSNIKLIVPNLVSTIFGSVPRVKSFNVIAIFNSGMYEYDTAVMLMSLVNAQSFLSMRDSINLIEINTDNPDIADKYSDILQSDFNIYMNDNNHKLAVTSWKDQNEQFLTALEVERVAMFVILSLIILVAAFNILTSLFMVVKDHIKDIAILRTIGANKIEIMSIFVIHGMINGIIGVVFGVLFGVLISYNIENIRLFLETITDTKIFDPAIYFLYHLPSVIRIFDVLFVVVITLSLCFLATLYPSYRAARLNPVDAMRYE